MDFDMKSLKIFIFVFIATINLGLFAAEDSYQVAFYTDFEPVSLSESRDPNAEGFNSALGMEPAIIRAMELIPGSTLRFEFRGVKQWDQLWMKPVTDKDIDIAIGGMTIEERRTRDENGKQVITFSHPTLQFKQSLLILAENQKFIKTHKDLRCTEIVGAVPGTTGEFRFLVQAGIINNLKEGFIEEGVTVVLPRRGYKRSDGKLSIYDPTLSARLYLIPSNCNLPLVRYFVGEDEMIPALMEKDIHAIARGYIGNTLVAERFPEELFVTAVYSLEDSEQSGRGTQQTTLSERAGFTVLLAEGYS